MSKFTVAAVTLWDLIRIADTLQLNKVASGNSSEHDIIGNKDGPLHQMEGQLWILLGAVILQCSYVHGPSCAHECARPRGAQITDLVAENCLNSAWNLMPQNDL